MTAFIVIPMQREVMTALRNFLVAVLPPATKVVQGQVNRVPEPLGDFAVFWPISLVRMATNVDTYEDVLFTAQIVGMHLYVVEHISGTILPGDSLFGEGVAPGTLIIAQLDVESSILNDSPLNSVPLNTPSLLVYSISISQNVPLEMMAAGREILTQTTDISIQIDLHGPSSMDSSQIVSTLLRDEHGVDLFEGTGVVPMYCDDPKQLPFINEAQQYEDRYVITVHLQSDRAFFMPQQFADKLAVLSINAEL